MKKLSKFEVITKFCEGLNRNLANSLLLIGQTGTGKTESILSSLKNLGLKEDTHYRYFSNYATPLELYNILRQVNDLEHPSILVVDDGEEILTNQKAVSILRSALWGYPKRMIYWYSTSPKVPVQKFEFTGKIIFLANKLNLKNPLIRALVSRGFFYNLALSNREMLALMRERAKEEYKGLKVERRFKIMNYIEEIGRNSDKLNLRILNQIYTIYLLSPNHWRELSLELLKS